tara:strand:+ start:326 stop:673 length:348 start_codon:yes stop_codon:yes gene_type:complete
LLSLARSFAILSALGVGSYNLAELELTIKERCFLNFIQISFTQNVRIASVINGANTISATGSNPYTPTPVAMSMTSTVMKIQSNANAKRNKNISITSQVKVTAYAATSVTVGAVE